MANGVGADDILGLFHHIHHINGNTRSIIAVELILKLTRR